MDKITRDMVDRSVKMIAIARRTCVATRYPLDKFDEELNAMCERWHNKFMSMSDEDMMYFMVEDLMDDVRKGEAERRENDG